MAHEKELQQLKSGKNRCTLALILRGSCVVGPRARHIKMALS